MKKEFRAGLLNVQEFEDRDQLGNTAAGMVAGRIQELLKTREYLNMIFAAAPSQNEFLAALAAMDLPWERINAFHMDEYIGLPPTAPQLFSHFLREALFGKLGFRSVHYINGNAANTEAEMSRYEELLKQYPVDIVCMGIGENGHIAFNDPPVADFKDPVLVKKVELEEACRVQQVNDGCFNTLQEVPKEAITLTVPALMRGHYLYCMVPGEKKAEAVYHTIYAPISEAHPSTILRNHPQAVLYIDRNSASKLENLEVL